MTASLTSSMTVLRLIAVAPSTSMSGPSPSLKQQHHENAHYPACRVSLALARCLVAKPNGAAPCFPNIILPPFKGGSQHLL